MIYTCNTCAHQSEEDVAPMRKGNIQPGVERWCYGKCKTTRFHYAALSSGQPADEMDQMQRAKARAPVLKLQSASS